MCKIVKNIGHCDGENILQNSMISNEFLIRLNIIDALVRHMIHPFF